MRLPVFLSLAVCLAGPLVAQEPPRPAPLPDHWLTLDSLTALVGLTADQRAKVAPPYTALNAVVKQAADKRAALRRQFRRPNGSSPDPTPEQRQAMRARMDSVRAEFEGLQEEANMWHGTIRNLLTAVQQAKFDALPPPRVTPQFRRPGGGPGE
ncbi:MAG: hypothetical protein ACREL9_12570 [Gemmatimonadales bacterium]